MKNNIDEVALNCLLLNDVPPLTAVAGSVIDSEPQPASVSRRWFDLGLIAGLALWLVWQFC